MCALGVEPPLFQGTNDLGDNSLYSEHGGRLGVAVRKPKKIFTHKKFELECCRRRSRGRNNSRQAPEPSQNSAKQSRVLVNRSLQNQEEVLPAEHSNCGEARMFLSSV